MKKAVSLLISVALVFNLCACSMILPNESELVKLDTSSFGDIFAISHDSNEKYTALFYTDFVFDEGENSENISEEEIFEPEEADQNYYLAVFDSRRGALLENIEIENEDDGGYFVDVSDDEIMLKNEQNAEMITYDFELKNRSEGEYDFNPYWEQTQMLDAVDANRWASLNGYTVSSNFGEYQALLFYDRPQDFYILKENVYYNYRDLCGHKMLVEDNSDNVNTNPKSVLRVFDFDTKAEINSITVENNFDFNNIQITSFNERRVTFSTCFEDGKFDSLYVWNYGLNAKNTALENGFCEVIGANEVDLKIDEASRRIESTYGIGFECSPELDFIREQYAYSNDFKAIDFYLNVLDIEKYLSLLPKQLYSEILGKNLENSFEQFDEFRIYLVGHFDDGIIDAYESNFYDEATGTSFIYIVYSFVGLNQKTFFHELMHAMEHQIWAAVPDFDEEWQKLNPTDFEYTDDYVEVYYNEQNEAWQEYFTRDYGMKNVLEDRATCFEELCDGAFSDSCWWSDKPHIVEKQKYLAEVLDKTYPSLDMTSLVEKAIAKGNAIGKRSENREKNRFD